MKIINDKSDRIVKVECAETPNNIRSNIGIDLKFIDLSDRIINVEIRIDPLYNFLVIKIVIRDPDFLFFEDLKKYMFRITKENGDLFYFIVNDDSYAYNNKDKTCYFSAVQI